MDTETPKEKPNYVLHYRAECREDCLDSDHHFNSPDDDHAREVALSFIEEHNRRDRQEIVSGKKSQQDWFRYTPLRLERIIYVIKEVEERTSVPLQGDVASRASSGAPISLFDLIHI